MCINYVEHLTRKDSEYMNQLSLLEQDLLSPILKVNPNIHKEVINTILHEGRHAYQHYNVDVKCIHESGAEVETWREKFLR